MEGSVGDREGSTITREPRNKFRRTFRERSLGFHRTRCGASTSAVGRNCGHAARFPDPLLRMESAKMEKVLKVVPLGYAPASSFQGG